MDFLTSRVYFQKKRILSTLTEITQFRVFDVGKKRSKGRIYAKLIKPVQDFGSFDDSIRHLIMYLYRF